MEEEDKQKGPLSAFVNDDVVEIATPLFAPHTTTVGIVPLIPINDAIQRHLQRSQRSNLRNSMSAHSITSPVSSLSTTQRSCGFGSLHNMLGTVLEVPDRILIPLERLRLLRDRTLGKGAFGEVIRGELYPETGPNEHTFALPAIPHVSFSAQSTSNSTQDCIINNGKCCSEVSDEVVGINTEDIDCDVNDMDGIDSCELGMQNSIFSDQSPAGNCEWQTPQPSHSEACSTESPAQPLITISPMLALINNHIIKSEDDSIYNETANSFAKQTIHLTSFGGDTFTGNDGWSKNNSFIAEGPPKTVAVKLIDKSRLSRRRKFVSSFQTELNLAGTLSHPSIINIHGVAEDDTNLLLVMDVAEHGTILDYIKSQGLEDMIVMAPRFLADVILGLEYLHSIGISHCDIKPCNMLLTSDYHVKIGDFGSACYLNDDAANTFAGTAAYMSPEMVEDGKASATSDLWALGCVLFELFVGRPPFQGENRMFVMRKIKEYTTGDIEFPPYFPATAKDLVQRLLIREPRDRLGSQTTGAGFEDLKNHIFFASIDWNHITQSTSNSNINININPHNKDYTPQLQTLLTPGEKVLRCAIVLKKCGFIRKTREPRMLILTDLPRLFYTDVAGNVMRETIAITREVHAEVETAVRFKIITSARSYDFEDTSRHADMWGMKINDLASRAPAGVTCHNNNNKRRGTTGRMESEIY